MTGDSLVTIGLNHISDFQVEFHLLNKKFVRKTASIYGLGFKHKMYPLGVLFSHRSFLNQNVLHEVIYRGVGDQIVNSKTMNVE